MLSLSRTHTGRQGSYPTLSYPILSYPILSYPILSYPILSYPIGVAILSGACLHRQPEPRHWPLFLTSLPLWPEPQHLFLIAKPSSRAHTPSQHLCARPSRKLSQSSTQAGDMPHLDSASQEKLAPLNQARPCYSNP